MSTALTKARTQLKKVGTYVRQKKFHPAVQALYDAVLAIMKNPLMKQEKDEFIEFIKDAIHSLEIDKEFNQLYPLQLNYSPGDEKGLLAQLRECLKNLEADTLAAAKDQLAAMEAKKEEEFQKGKKLLQEQQFDEAKGHYKKLTDEFEDDFALKVKVGEEFLANGLYEEAFNYLSQALEDNPKAVHLYNRIGMALRKLGRFDVAEKYYLRGLKIMDKDPNLLFNMGRLYVDWHKWDKAVKVAERAVALNPEFVEAQKMLTFAQKKLDKENKSKEL